MEHPYPDHAYLERDEETNEKRWFSSIGMGVRYIHEDRAAEDVEKAVAAEREACAAVAAPPTEQLYAPTHGAWDRGYEQGRIDAAAAIRERNNSTQ